MVLSILALQMLLPKNDLKQKKKWECGAGCLFAIVQHGVPLVQGCASARCNHAGNMFDVKNKHRTSRGCLASLTFTLAIHLADEADKGTKAPSPLAQRTRCSSLPPGQFHAFFAHSGLHHG